MVGKTEAQLTRAGVSYEVGVADYREVRRREAAVAQIGFYIDASCGAIA